MTIFKNKFNGKLYTNSDGTFTGFPLGKVLEENKIIKNCKLEDFVVFKIERNKVSGFI